MGEEEKPKVKMQRKEVAVARLFDGKLGVKLKGGMYVVGFDHPEAKEFGWQLHDEIVEVNGRAISDRNSFAKEFTEARKTLPITFTVMRSVKHTKKRDSEAHQSNSRVKVVKPDGEEKGTDATNGSRKGAASSIAASSTSPGGSRKGAGNDPNKALTKRESALSVDSKKKNGSSSSQLSAAGSPRTTDTLAQQGKADIRNSAAYASAVTQDPDMMSEMKISVSPKE